MIIISNTSPISNLAMVRQLALLQQIYSKIIIPTAIKPVIDDLIAQAVVPGE